MSVQTQQLLIYGRLKSKDIFVEKLTIITRYLTAVLNLFSS